MVLRGASASKNKEAFASQGIIFLNPSDYVYDQSADNKDELWTWGLSHFRGKEADKPVEQISPGNFIDDQTTFHAKDLFATWAHGHSLPHLERAGWREGGTPSPRLYSAHNKVISWWALKLSSLPKCFLVIKMLPTWWSTQAESSVCKYLNPSIGELFNSWNL